ncbi:ATP-dependent translocase ABCB1-like [Sarcophilus harrisii]|uniref:ATP-dependent translocase ABCB1-like n=1 Tax=Sarcophilus harrisii TaxID=9305 RepID=UPI001301AE1E|nr:ATP-dependent translocase ABCB1-like [Sarcophilus harrisii]
MSWEGASNGSAKSPTEEKTDSKSESESKKIKKKEKQPTISTFAMFRYSNWLDRLYMVLGTAAAIIHGAGVPLMMLVFGEMTDSFADMGNQNISAMDQNASKEINAKLEKDMTT